MAKRRAPTSRVSPGARIGKNASIGDYTVIHDGVVIGDGAVIDSHCVIGYPTKLAQGKPLILGRDARIRSHTVIYQGSTFGDGLMTGHYALLRENCRAGKRLQVGSQTDLEGDSVFGHYVTTHSDVHVSKHSRIGDFAVLLPRVQFTGDPFPPSHHEESITVKDMAVICAGTLLLPGVTVGLGSFVAAGSVVRADVPDLHCAGGNPLSYLRLDKFFSPRFGPYHPWGRRFKEKYPPESYPLMEKIIRGIDRRLAAAEPKARP